MNLTNDEARFLIDLQKRMHDRILKIPAAGETERYPASDLEGLQDFVFRMRMARGNHSNRHKATYLLFYDKNTQLLRLDTDGTGLHTNADGTTIPPHTPHIHIYDEQEKDHNAYPLPPAFSNPFDFFQTVHDFLIYAKVIDTNKLQIVDQGGLTFNENIHR